jgi:hypothetical protein
LERDVATAKTIALSLLEQRGTAIADRREAGSAARLSELEELKTVAENIFAILDAAKVDGLTRTQYLSAANAFVIAEPKLGDLLADATKLYDSYVDTATDMGKAKFKISSLSDLENAKNAAEAVRDDCQAVSKGADCDVEIEALKVAKGDLTDFDAATGTLNQMKGNLEEASDEAEKVVTAIKELVNQLDGVLSTIRVQEAKTMSASTYVLLNVTDDAATRADLKEQFINAAIAGGVPADIDPATVEVEIADGIVTFHVNGNGEVTSAAIIAAESVLSADPISIGGFQSEAGESATLALAVKVMSLAGGGIPESPIPSIAGRRLRREDTDSAQAVADFQDDMLFHVVNSLCPPVLNMQPLPKLCGVGGKDAGTPYIEDKMTFEYCLAYDEFGSCEFGPGGGGITQSFAA